MFKILASKFTGMMTKDVILDISEAFENLYNINSSDFFSDMFIFFFCFVYHVSLWTWSQIQSFYTWINCRILDCIGRKWSSSQKHCYSVVLHHGYGRKGRRKVITQLINSQFLLTLKRINKHEINPFVIMLLKDYLLIRLDVSDKSASPLQLALQSR